MTAVEQGSASPALRGTTEGALVERIDHVAIEVRDFDAMVGRLEQALGTGSARIGRLVRDPSRRIASVRDAAGFTLEIIEAPVFHRGAPTLDHVALRVRELDATQDALLAAGFQRRVVAKPVDAWQRENAVLADPTGLVVQLVRYDDASDEASAADAG